MSLTINRAASLPVKLVPSVSLLSDKFVTVAWTPAMPSLSIKGSQLLVLPRRQISNSQEEQDRANELSVHGMDVKFCNLEHALPIP